MPNEPEQHAGGLDRHCHLFWPAVISSTVLKNRLYQVDTFLYFMVSLLKSLCTLSCVFLTTD